MQMMKFQVDPGWQVLLKDLEIDPAEVLLRAQLPADLFSRTDMALSAPEYFQLWDAMVATSNDSAFPLKLGRSISVESFNPPIFAALCSPNLNVAMERLSHFKRLIGPMTLDVDISESATTISLDCLYKDHPLPDSLVSTELVFLVHLIRLATRETITPMAIVSTSALIEKEGFSDFFGIAPTLGSQNTLQFSASDAQRPFLTVNERMWHFFEPELRKRLSEIEREEGFATRVRSALLELLPSGQSTIDDVAGKLALSRRTLQRRLGEESTSFQVELNKTREQLARHYLSNSTLTGAQISFLLGFEDPNSFVRAFQSWTGQTPRQLRQSDKSFS